MYVYLKTGEVRGIDAAVTARLVTAPDGDDSLECLDAEGAVLARFVSADVLFYSRLPQDAFGGLPPDAQPPAAGDRIDD